MRLTVANILPAESLGEFSLEAQQGDVSAVFVPLTRLQQDLDITGRVNTMLVSSGLSPPADAAAALRALVRREAQLDDLGLPLETVDSTGVLGVGAECRPPRRCACRGGDGAHSKAPGCRRAALFTYLANSLRLGEREVPYSLVTALDLATIEPDSHPACPIERSPSS